jgi:hypothetical protein
MRRQIYKELSSIKSTPKVSFSILYCKSNLMGILPHLSLLETCQQI